MTLAGKFLAAVEVARPLNSAMVGLAVIIGVHIGSGGSSSWLGATDYAVLYAAAFLLSASIMTLNDVVDHEIDRINAPQRPIPSGRLSRGEALIVSSLYSLAGLSLAIAHSAATTLAYVMVWLAGNVYNLWAKRLGLPGNVIVATLVAFPLLFGAYLAGFKSPAPILFSSMIWLATMGREIAKGIVDVDGDRAAGVRTLAVSMGRRRAAVAAAAFYLAAASIGFAPAVYPGLGINTRVYLPLISLLAIAIAIESYRLVSNPTREEAYRHKKRVLAYMLLGLLAFYLGYSP